MKRPFFQRFKLNLFWVIGLIALGIAISIVINVAFTPRVAYEPIPTSVVGNRCNGIIHDCDCKDLKFREAAMVFYTLYPGDPNGLDSRNDSDFIPCNSLPSACSAGLHYNAKVCNLYHEFFSPDYQAFVDHYKNFPEMIEQRLWNPLNEADS